MEVRQDGDYLPWRMSLSVEFIIYTWDLLACQTIYLGFTSMSDYIPGIY